MKIAIIGYGKMGKAIEEIAINKGHEIILKINSQNLAEFTKENLQKADVYALGLAIFIMLYVYSDVDVRGNADLYDLLIHMIAMDPDKRYNAVQCLSHPFLQSVNKK